MFHRTSDWTDSAGSIWIGTGRGLLWIWVKLRSGFKRHTEYSLSGQATTSFSGNTLLNGLKQLLSSCNFCFLYTCFRQKLRMIKRLHKNNMFEDPACILWRWSRDNSFDTLSRLRSGRPGNRRSILSEGRECSLLHNVETGSGAHPTSYVVCTGGSFPGARNHFTL
jgi:hypothetical protein